MVQSKTILALCGDFGEDLEMMVPAQSLMALGYEVHSVCIGKKAGEQCKTAVHDFEGAQTYSEKPGHNFTLSYDFDKVRVEQYAGLYIPGGRAPEYLALNETVVSIVNEFFQRNLPVASVCHGQLVLCAANVLSGRTLTAYPACKPAVVGAGGKWLDPEPITKCFTNENLVTGAAWPAHPELIGQFIRLLGAKVENANDKKVLMLCGDYMEDYEAFVPFQFLEALGVTVHSVCPGRKNGEYCLTAIHDFEGAQTYSEKPGHRFTLNYDFDRVDVSEYDGLLIPGGRAPEYLALNDRILEITRSFFQANKAVASICHGQQILVAAGVLKGRKCTAYPALEPLVKIAGGEWCAPAPIEKCFTDGNLVTGAAWPAHPQFMAQFAAALGIKISI